MNRTFAKKLAATLALAAGFTFTGAHGAFADSIYFTSNGKLAATEDVTCNNGNHLMTASMVIAPEPGYEAGQYVHYQVVIKDVTFGTDAAWQYFAWQGPFVVKTTTFMSGGIRYVVQGQQVPSYTITGIAGHRYMVGAIVEWWNPSSRVWEGRSIVTDTTISQYVWNGSSYYYLETGLCWT